MRAAIAIGLLVLATTTVGGAGDAAAQVLGFDHIVHDGRITVLGRPSLDCTSCHPITATGALVGRPGHKACLGACHTWTPRPGVALAEELVEVCATCHDPEALTRPKPPVAFPPYVLEPDYPMTLSHAKHAGARCEQCHTAPGAKAAAPRPHARCTSCHGSTATPMTACTTCHIAAYGANALPRLVRGPLSVGAAYSHARHASRTPAEAVGCAACHASISTADGLELTPPTAMQCATGGCHDGPRAFSITERCTSCHTTAPRTRFDVARPDARFSHDAHASRLALDDCAACHGLDGRGERGADGVASDHRREHREPEHAPTHHEIAARREARALAVAIAQLECQAQGGHVLRTREARDRNLDDEQPLLGADAQEHGLLVEGRPELEPLGARLRLCVADAERRETVRDHAAVVAHLPGASREIELGSGARARVGAARGGVTVDERDGLARTPTDRAGHALEGQTAAGAVR